MKLQLASGFSVLLLASGAASAQQTLTFSNTDTDPGAPVVPQVITLLGGSTVSISPNGNLTASCVLGTGGSTLCQGTGGGNVGDVPTVSLAASNFNNQPVAGQYPVTTSFTLTPTVTNAQYCVRTVSPTTPANTGWPAGIAQAPIAPQQVFLRTVSSTYQFSLKCYNDAGSTTFTHPNIVTNATDLGGGGGSCSSFQVPLPSGWQRLASPQSMPQVPLLAIGGAFWNDFPNGGGRGVIATPNGRYIALAINTPADAGVWASQAPSRRIYWDTSQAAGEANVAKIYVTISECAGDFRLPPAGSAPTTDPTYARGCRSYRPFSAGGSLAVQSEINYEISDQPSDELKCRLATGRTYHINFIRADVRDGSIGTTTEETGLCINSNLTSCGVDMNVE